MQLVNPDLGLIIGLIIIGFIIYALFKLFSSNTLLSILLILGGLIIIPVILKNSKKEKVEEQKKFEYLEQQKREQQKREQQKREQQRQEELRKKNAPGSSSCRYAIERRIREIGGMHTGIEHKGNGKFIAFVANSTTNYNYKITYFYTNADCDIINVIVK